MQNVAEGGSFPGGGGRAGGPARVSVHPGWMLHKAPMAVGDGHLSSAPGQAETQRGGRLLTTGLREVGASEQGAGSPPFNSENQPPTGTSRN